MSELKVNYQGTDFVALKRDTQDFQRIKSIVEARTASKKKIKVKI